MGAIKTISKHFLQIGILMLASLCLLMQAQAFAQTRTLTENEKAIFAFYKLNEDEPSFTDWIKSSKIYKKAPRERQAEIFEQELQRLKWEFSTYDYKKDYLEIKTTVQAQISGSQGDKPPVFFFHFPHEEQDYIPYFPYRFDESWIALLLDDLPAFTNIPLKEGQYDHIKHYIPFDNTPYDIELALEIRPISADNRTPYNLFDVDQWLMMGNIASLRFTAIKAGSGGKTVFWEYIAPWYDTGGDESFLNLLKK